MNKITICVDKVAEYKICGSHRTSDGWIYRESETISPKVWFSEPITIEDIIAQRLFDFLSKFNSYDIDEDAGWGRQNSTKFEPDWTLQVVAVLSFALSKDDYVFEAYDGSSPFTKAFYLEKGNNHYCIARFTGYAYPKRTLERLLSPESPFSDINELKRGIEQLVKTGNQIPDRWLAFLFVNTQEDISSFLTQNSISLINREIGICQGNGELLPSLLNVNEGIVDDYKMNRPSISYEQACRKHLESDIQWYQRYGADWQIESRYKHYHSSNHNEPEDYSYGQDEMNSWEEGWQWNVD